MNILLIEQYSKHIQDIIEYTDDILRAVVSNDELRQDIRDKWYPDDDIDWDAPLLSKDEIEALLKAEACNYTFDPYIFPDNFFNE